MSFYDKRYNPRQYNFEQHWQSCIACSRAMRTINIQTNITTPAKEFDEKAWRRDNMCRIGRRLYKKAGEP